MKLGLDKVSSITISGSPVRGVVSFPGYLYM